MLLHLTLHPEESFTKYALDKATGLRTPSVAQHLERLVMLGWVKKCETFPVTFKVNLENEVAKILTELFSELKHTII